MPPSQPHLQLVPLCLLCRARADGENTIGFCDIPPHLLVRHHAAASSVSTTFREVAMRCAATIGADLGLCQSPHHGCEPVGHLHLVHLACWKVARGLHTARSLVALARRSLPLFPAGIGGLPSDALTMRADLRCLRPRRDTSLGRLVGRISTRLPAEVQARIVGDLGEENQLACLVRATHVAASSPSDAKPRRRPTRQLRTSHGPVTHIRAPKSSMFGRLYLRDIQPCCGVDGVNGADGFQAESIMVRQASLRGIRFAIDQHGIRGLRVVYADGAESPLLGSDKDCWHGEARGESLEKLWVTRDDFRVIRIDFDDDPIAADGTHRALWSSRSALTENVTNVMAISSRSSPQSPISFYPGWRFIQYVPLSHDGDYTSGITAFMKEGRAVGLHVPDARPQGSGRRGSGSGATTVGTLGAPNHFALGSGERITGAWARRTYGRLFDDCLVLMTSTGRVHVLGAHEPLNIGGEFRSERTSLTGNTPCEIQGLLFDPVTSSYNLGASFTPLPGGTSPPPLPSIPYEAGRDDKVLSVAPLHGVKTIRVLKQQRKDSSRVTGLYFEYHGGRAAALGRWDPRNADYAETLWPDTNDTRPLEGIAFRIDKTRAEPLGSLGLRVGDVVPMTGQKHPTVGNWKILEASTCENIAWWWSEGSDEDYSDTVEEWKEATEWAGQYAVGNAATVL